MGHILMKRDTEKEIGLMTKELKNEIVKSFKRYASLVEKYIAEVEEKEALSTDDINTINDCIRMFAHMATTIYRLNACSD